MGKDSRERSSAFSLESGLLTAPESSPVPGQLRPVPNLSPPPNSSSLLPLQLPNTLHPRSKPPACPNPRKKQSSSLSLQSGRDRPEKRRSSAVPGQVRLLPDPAPPRNSSSLSSPQLLFTDHPQTKLISPSKSTRHTACLAEQNRASHGVFTFGQAFPAPNSSPPFSPEALASEMASLFFSDDCEVELDQRCIDLPDLATELKDFLSLYLQSPGFSLLSKEQKLLWTSPSSWRKNIPWFLLAPRPLPKSCLKKFMKFTEVEKTTMNAFLSFERPSPSLSSAGTSPEPSPTTSPSSSPENSPPPSPKAATIPSSMDQQSMHGTSSSPLPKVCPDLHSSLGTAAVPPAVLPLSPHNLNFQTPLSPPKPPHSSPQVTPHPPASFPTKKSRFRRIPPPHCGKGILPIPTHSPYLPPPPLFFPLHITTTPHRPPAHCYAPPPHTGKGILPNPVCFLPSLPPLPYPLYIPFTPPYPSQFLWLAPVFSLARLLDPAFPPSRRRRRQRKRRQRSERHAPAPATTPPATPPSGPPSLPAHSSPVPSHSAISTPLPSSDAISSPVVASTSTSSLPATSSTVPALSAISTPQPSSDAISSPVVASVSTSQSSEAARSPTAGSRLSAQSSAATRPPSTGSRPQRLPV